MGSENLLLELARSAGEQLEGRGLRLATAESCTGGWIAKTLTDVAGSSAWFEYGYVTYSNRAKENLLGVAQETLQASGAVSAATVREMARGALARSGANISVAVSGVAGPDGGTPDKPVGTVWFGWAWRDGEGIKTRTRRALLAGDREAVRRQSVAEALKGVLAVLPAVKKTAGGDHAG